MTDWVEVADRVWVRNYESLDLNVGVVAGDEALLVVDTRANAVEGGELRGHIGELSELPVGWVVNTHFHFDHTWGNEVFTGAPIWGHVRCAEVMRERGEHDRELVKEWAPEHADRFDTVTITPPDHTFTDAATLDIGGRAVELAFLGRGHTDSDIVARVGAVTFAGDLIENGAPPAFGDAFPLDWPGTVAALLAGFADGPVIPGHGPVADRAFVTEQHAQLAEIAQLARDRFAAGLSAEDAARAGTPFPAQAAVHAFRRAYLQLETK